MNTNNPKSVAKRVTNPLDRAVAEAIKNGWRVTTRSKGRVLVLSNRPDGEKG